MTSLPLETNMEALIINWISLLLFRNILFISFRDLNCLFPSGPLALQEINSLRSLQEINLYIPSRNLMILSVYNGFILTDSNLLYFYLHWILPMPWPRSKSQRGEGRDQSQYHNKVKVITNVRFSLILLRRFILYGITRCRWRPKCVFFIVIVSNNWHLLMKSRTIFVIFIWWTSLIWVEFTFYKTY